MYQLRSLLQKFIQTFLSYNEEKWIYGYGKEDIQFLGTKNIGDRVHCIYQPFRTGCIWGRKTSVGDGRGVPHPPGTFLYLDSSAVNSLEMGADRRNPLYPAGNFIHRDGTWYAVERLFIHQWSGICNRRIVPVTVIYEGYKA